MRTTASKLLRGLIFSCLLFILQVPAVAQLTLPAAPQQTNLPQTNLQQPIDLQQLGQQLGLPEQLQLPNAVQNQSVLQNPNVPQNFNGLPIPNGMQGANGIQNPAVQNSGANGAAYGSSPNPPAGNGVGIYGPQHIPFQPLVTNGELQVTGNNDLITVISRQADLRIVLATIAEENNLNIVAGNDVAGTVSVTLHNVPVTQALDAILRINGYIWQVESGIIYVSKPEQKAVHGPMLYGLQLRVFELNYVSAAEVLNVVSGLLSPAGKAFSHAAAPTNSRQTRERLIVEDFPERVHRITEYIAFVDNPPRQVLLEAQVLQVTLGNDQRHGVNLDQVARIAGANVTFATTGMSTTTAAAAASTAPNFLLSVDGTDLNAVIECLKSQSYVRTLATPKLLVVNGQVGRIQIGSQLGYTTIQQNQTSTIQNVEFLQIGVVLEVTPIISRDGNILMKVLPKVSGGRINPDTKLPEEDTTETETTVLLPDGRGMIIGGLIKEDETRKSSFIPWLGELKYIGRLFRRDSQSVTRSEIIIAITPHVVPYCEPILTREASQYVNLTGLTPAYGPPGMQGANGEPVPWPVDNQTPLLQIPDPLFPQTTSPPDLLQLPMTESQAVSGGVVNQATPTYVPR